VTSQSQPSVEICVDSNFESEIAGEIDDGISVSEQTPRLQPGSPRLDDAPSKDLEPVAHSTECRCYEVVMTGAGLRQRTSRHHTLPEAEGAAQEALWRGRTVVIRRYGHVLRGPLEVIDHGRGAS
jgi:hypothetical protein